MHIKNNNNKDNGGNHQHFFFFLYLALALDLMSTDANFPKNGKDVDDYAEGWIEKLALTNQPIPIPEHIYNLSGGVSLPVQMENKLKSEAPKKPKVSFAPGDNEDEKERVRQEAEKQFERARNEHIRNVAHAMQRAREDEIQQGKFGLKNAIMEILQNSNEQEEGGNPLPNSLITKMHYDRLKKKNNQQTDKNSKEKTKRKMPPKKNTIPTKKRKGTKKKNPFIDDEAEEDDDDNTIIEQEQELEEEAASSPSDPPVYLSPYTSSSGEDDDDDDGNDEIEKSIPDKNVVSGAHNGKSNGKYKYLSVEIAIMPLLDETKLFSCFLSGNGCSSTDDNTITSKAIKYKDLRKLVIASDNIIEESKGRCLYGGGRHGQTRQKKRKRMNDNDDHDDQDDDDEKKELATQAKHAKLFEYYNLYKQYEGERLRHQLKANNPLKTMNQNDFYNIKSYFDDYKNGLIKDAGKTYDLRLKVPFSCLIVGKSKSGKTTLLLDILSQWRSYTTDENGEYEKRIFWIYGTENGKDFHKLNEIIHTNYKTYGEDVKIPKIEYFKGDLKNAAVIERITSIPEKSIVILDDLMTEMVKSESISNVLTRESHHKKWNVFLLWQDMYPQQQFAKTISLQCDYKYIFRDPPRQDRLRTLCLQMFPNGSEGRDMFKKIWNFFTRSSPEDYPYIRINLRPDSPHSLLIMANDLIRDKKSAKFGIFNKPIKLFTF